MSWRPGWRPHRPRSARSGARTSIRDRFARRVGCDVMDEQLPGFQTVARTATRDCPIALHRSGAEYTITSCQQVLMTSEQTGSERALGRLAAFLVGRVRSPRVLVGGLGMGFTLRALLDRLPAGARVVVAELLPAVARWNRRHFGHLSARPLDDPRVRLRIGDVADMVPGQPMWDAIVLDVDNGPNWVVQRRNGACTAAKVSPVSSGRSDQAACWPCGPPRRTHRSRTDLERAPALAPVSTVVAT